MPLITLREILQGSTAQPQESALPGASMDFYKCTYVSSDSSMTWRGRKAVLDNGAYDFQSNSTSLVYDIGLFPQVGGIYSSDVKIKVGQVFDMPAKGLVFHAPLFKSQAQAATGQTLAPSSSADITYQVYKNIPCALLQNNSYIEVTDGLDTLPSGRDPWTISVWCSVPTDPSALSTAFGYGNTQTNRNIAINFGSPPSRYIRCVIYNNTLVTGFKYTVGEWSCVTYTYDGTTIKTYVNGIAGATVDLEMSLQQTALNIGCYGKYTQYPFNGYIAGARIYNRQLSLQEVQRLARQFNPIVSTTAD